MAHTEGVNNATLATPARSFSPTAILRQIGTQNLWAISGGRTNFFGDAGSIVRNEANELRLPVSHGYSVRVTLDANDLYTVERVFTRSGKYTVRRVEMVYCDDLAHVVYEASCFRTSRDWGIASTASTI